MWPGKASSGRATSWVCLQYNTALAKTTTRRSKEGKLTNQAPGCDGICMACVQVPDWFLNWY